MEIEAGLSVLEECLLKYKIKRSDYDMVSDGQYSNDTNQFIVFVLDKTKTNDEKYILLLNNSCVERKKAILESILKSSQTLDELNRLFLNCERGTTIEAKVLEAISVASEKIYSRANTINDLWDAFSKIPVGHPLRSVIVRDVTSKIPSSNKEEIDRFLKRDDVPSELKARALHERLY